MSLNVEIPDRHLPALILTGLVLHFLVVVAAVVLFAGTAWFLVNPPPGVDMDDASCTCPSTVCEGVECP